MNAAKWAALAAILLLGGCAATKQPNYADTQFQRIMAADTVPKEFRAPRAATDSRGPAGTELRMSEEDLQAEINRQLAIKPSAPMPSRVVLLEVPTSTTDITSPRKKLLLRKEAGEAMRKALEDSGMFKSVDFLPDAYLPDDWSDLRVLRLAAARAQADGLLIYTTESGFEQRLNGWAALYPTLIGAAIAPGTNVSSIALSKAVLVDVRTGYIYQMIESYGEARDGVTAFAGRESAEFEARKASLATLATSARDRVKKMERPSDAKP